METNKDIFIKNYFMFRFFQFILKKLSIQLLFLTLLINTIHSTVFAQKEAYNWYFGTFAGLSFATAPPTTLTNGALSTSEGCASISDENGNLLFYTNGNAVWNKNHQVMDNGTGLHGQSSSTQSALIVKVPGSTTLYYVFTVADQGNANGYEYSIVDMSFNAGAGKVVTKNAKILKDYSNTSSAFLNSTEALTAAYHKNQTDVWVILHEATVTKFYAYLLTAGGLQAPVISDIGNQKTNLGQCRISPDGKRIAVGGYFGSGVDLYDFNSSSGVISNVVPLISGPSNRVYGLSFSPNSKVLYVTDNVANIYQFDLSQPTSTGMINSKYLVGQGSGGYYPQLQLGPDKRLYLAQKDLQYLGIIENPDVIGSGSSFIDNGISLGTKSSGLGLPTFMVNYVTSRPPVVSLGNDTILCPSAKIILDAGDNQDAGFLWSTQEQTQKITVSAPGKYYVDVTRDNVKVSDTIVVSYISFAALSVPHAYNYCGFADAALTLDPVFTEPQFQWQDGSTTLPYSVTAPGKYIVERINQNCSVKDTFIVTSLCLQEMIIPNLITPNKDGKNEMFAIKNLPIPDWSIEIYNRWGTLVYTAEEYQNDWGAHNVSDGLYFYHLKHRYNEETHKGWVEVLGSVK
jgi:gliding motility-associated-like protein